MGNNSCFFVSSILGYEDSLKVELSELFSYYSNSLRDLLASNSGRVNQFRGRDLEDILPQVIGEKLGSLVDDNVCTDLQAVALVREAIVRKRKQMQFTLESNCNYDEILVQAVNLSLSLYEQFKELFSRICRIIFAVSSSPYSNNQNHWGNLSTSRAESRNGSAFAA